jgi:hypothetical protein
MNGRSEQPEHGRQVDARPYALLEVTAILVLFFLYAGCPPPDVNESHYLAKAKHYWNPQWCAGDLFLESADAHTMFYWTLGWLTLYLPLPAVAWVVRLICWTGLAWAWQRLSYALLARRWISLLTAALLITLLDLGHLAGEWVIGGAEAKGLAYVLVLCGLRSVVLGRWGPMWAWFGAASAFHVIVGGWSVLIGGFAWLVAGQERPKIPSQLPWLVFGFILTLPGLIPAVVLSTGVDAETAQLADHIYVMKRLSHHLVFTEFTLIRHASFAAVLFAWGVACWQLRRDPKWWRLNRMAMGALLVAVAGILLNAVGILGWDRATRWLRFYWFRMSDVFLPIAVALAVPIILCKWSAQRQPWARWAWATVCLSCLGFTLTEFAAHQRDFRPRADIQSRPVSWHARLRYEQWRLMCAWIVENTEPTDCFLTPRDQQTFKWYAGRKEVVCWKDIPQDAASIVSWWTLRESIYKPQVVIDGLGAWTDEQLLGIARRHGADYILVDRSRTKRRLDLPLVRANPSPYWASFELYRVPESEAPTLTAPVHQAADAPGN